MAEDDPNPDTGKLAMDKAGLQAFLKDRVLPFQDEIRKIKTDDADLGPSMGTLTGDSQIDYSDPEFDSYGAGKPLAIGQMLNASNLQPAALDGKADELNQAVGKTAEDLLAIFDDQEKLFKDIEDNLQSTIDTLFTTQRDNLADIDGQDFLDVLEDVDDDLNSSTSGSSSSDTGGG